MLVKMIQKSGQNGENKEIFNKDLETLKNKQAMMNTTITEINNTLEESIAE